MNQVFARLRARSARLERHSSAEAAWLHGNATMQVLIACRPVIQSDSGISGPPERPHSGDGGPMAAQVPCRYRDPYSQKSTLLSGHPAGIHCIEAWSSSSQPPTTTSRWLYPHLASTMSILATTTNISRCPVFSHSAIRQRAFVLWVSLLSFAASRFSSPSSFSLQYHSDCSGPHSLLGRESQTRPF
jgi:hypothetical protein